MMVIVPIEILLFIAVIRNHVSGSLLGLAIRTREGELKKEEERRGGEREEEERKGEEEEEEGRGGERGQGDSLLFNSCHPPAGLELCSLSGS